MKATIEFDLPEEREEHYTYINAPRYRCALSTVFDWIRTQRKYAELTDEQAALVEDLANKLREEVEDLEI